MALVRHFRKFNWWTADPDRKRGQVFCWLTTPCTFMAGSGDLPVRGKAERKKGERQAVILAWL